ncbi:MAG: SpoIIE family protein phosphatase [Bacteroidetes bacterium]|nr:SpoIIE family protein phosphatase [Bacteroidota bacterium]
MNWSCFKNSLIIAITLIFFAGQDGLSQQQKFDSLKRLLKITSVPKERATLLVDIAKSIYNSIPDSSIGYCEEAENLSKKYNLEVQLAYSLHCESRYILLKGDIKTTIEKLNKAIVLFEKNKEQKGLAKAYSLKSIALGRLEKREEELDYLLRAKQIYIQLADNDGLSYVLPNLANTYNDIHQYQNALDALAEYENLNIAKSGKDFYVEINYGSIYFNQHKLEEAIKHFNLATDIAHQYKMLDSEITGLTHLAECYQEQKNSPLAKSYYFQALNLAKQHHLMVEEADALKGVTDLYETEQDFKNAFGSLKQYKKIQDSIFNIEKIKSINDIEHKLQLTEKEKIIAEQSLSLEKEKVALASSKNNALILIAGLIIIGIAFIFLFYHNSKTKKLFSLIKKQKLEVEHQKEIIEIKNKDVMDSIHYAKYIQGSMLPSSKAMNTLFPENFVLYKPKDVVAGDFYWTETIDHKPVLAVCDCTGHGVPGAMVSIVACNALNRAIKEFKLSNPALIFDKVNELMQETFSKSDYEVSDGMDGVLCIFDHTAMKLHVAAANNPVWIVSQPAIKTNLWEEPWQLSQVTADKRPIGKFKEEVSPFTLKTISIEKGEMIYLFSDGYADQFGGPKGKKFKYKQLQELLTLVAKKPLQEQHDILNKTIEDWRGNLDQVDDILVVGIRV